MLGCAGVGCEEEPVGSCSVPCV